MQGHIATFSSPIKWLREGLSAVRQAPFGMVSICIFYVFTMSLLGALPVVGLVIAAFFMPFGTMLVLNGTRQASEGRQPAYGILADLFKNPLLRSRLMNIGAIYSIFIIVANYAYIFLAVDQVSQWEIIDGRLNWNSVLEHFPWTAAIVTVIVYAAGQMATWFSPALVTLKNMPVGKATFYSFFGCLRNWLPILILLVIIFGVTVFGAYVLIVLTETFRIGDYSLFFLTPLAFFITTVAYSTIWPMWVDIFGDVSEN